MTDIVLPSNLAARFGSLDVGDDWLRALPAVVRECTKQWQLTLGDPFEYEGAGGFAIPGVTADGQDVVLKVQYPHHENEHEPTALTVWDGDAAVKLLAHDAGRRALLLERCVPGTPLADIEPDAGLDVIIGLLPCLWKPVGRPFTALADEAAWWAGYLEEQWQRLPRPFEHELIDVALDALRTLPNTQGEQVLVNQDLHADNVLAAQREPWLVIDPAPLAGEREFSAAPIVRSREMGHSKRQVQRRLDRLCDELSLDRQRAGLWTIAQTIAWSMDGGRYHDVHIDVARWVLEAIRK